MDRVKEVLSHAYADSTRETYAAGLLAFHVFCNQKAVPEQMRAPASTDLIASFVATLAGAYAGSTIRNYVSGVRAWHILNRLLWELDKPTMDTILKAADIDTPASSKRSTRPPITVAMLAAFRDKLDLMNSRDAAIWACAVCAFYGVARLGELTVKKVRGADTKKMVRPHHYAMHQTDRHGNKVNSLFIPFTKAAGSKGEPISFAKQNGLTDPEEAMDNHLRVNKPADSEHLFTHVFNGRRTPLSKYIFLERIKGIARTLAPEDPAFSQVFGHSFRIGGTLEYLLRGIPFQVVKTMGRWASDSFQLYLRQHAQILAPYLQDNEQFQSLAMPAIRAARR